MYDERRCFKCGEKGHFITYCKNDNPAEWVKSFDCLLDSKKTNIKRLCLECNMTITSSPSNHRYCRDCFFLS